MSVNLTKQIRDIIEKASLPEDLVANFDKLFHGQIEEAREFAREAVRAHDLLQEPVRPRRPILQRQSND